MISYGTTTGRPQPCVSRSVLLQPLDVSCPYDVPGMSVYDEDTLRRHSQRSTYREHQLCRPISRCSGRPGPLPLPMLAQGDDIFSEALRAVRPDRFRGKFGAESQWVAPHSQASMRHPEDLQRSSESRIPEMELKALPSSNGATWRPQPRSSDSPMLTSHHWSPEHCLHGPNLNPGDARASGVQLIRERHSFGSRPDPCQGQTGAAPDRSSLHRPQMAVGERQALLEREPAIGQLPSRRSAEAPDAEAPGQKSHCAGAEGQRRVPESEPVAARPVPSGCVRPAAAGGVAAPALPRSRAGHPLRQSPAGGAASEPGSMAACQPPRLG